MLSKYKLCRRPSYAVIAIPVLQGINHLLETSPLRQQVVTLTLSVSGPSGAYVGLSLGQSYHGFLLSGLLLGGLRGWSRLANCTESVGAGLA